MENKELEIKPQLEIVRFGPNKFTITSWDDDETTPLYGNKK